MPTCENRCFVWARAQFWGVWRVQERLISEVFFWRGNRCGLVKYFSSILRCVCALGLQNEIHVLSKNTFFNVLTIFGPVLEGVGGRVGAPGLCRICKHGASVSSHPAPPSGVRCRAAHPTTTRFSKCTISWHLSVFFVIACYLFVQVSVL